MEVPFLDLRRRLATLRPEIERAMASVLDGETLILGPAVRRFEEAFAAYCGARHAVGVASGTDAITLSLQALGIGPGDEVITAANTCVPTVAAIRSTGATPVLVDPHPRTWTLDPDALPGARTERTSAIVPVHLYGRPADMPAICQFARAHGLVVVEDAAQAHGASCGDARAGTLGHAAAFSFYPTKNLGALGDAGMVVTNDAAVAVAVRERRTYGLRDGRAITAAGNSRLDEIHASALLVALEQLDAWTARRREIADRYRTAFDGQTMELQEQSGNVSSSCHLFVIAVPERERFRNSMERRGVGTLVHYPHPIHHHPAFEREARTPMPLHVSEDLARRVVSLPLYPEITDDEVERVIETTMASLRS